MYDTVEFLLKNVPNNNGKVGIWGISYPGFYTSASIIDSHRRSWRRARRRP
ncbi:MAG: CocE/NonD family hydrolase [Terracidiphilus sp.]